jgi:Zn-dependent alcohol dehydrogenase
MTDGGVDRSLECTGNVEAMISAFECVHDVCMFFLYFFYSLLLYVDSVIFMLSQNCYGRVGGSPLLWVCLPKMLSLRLSL